MMASTSRQSMYSLSGEHAPDWLTDLPLAYDEFLRPPSYLVASFQQAFDEFSFPHDPPTYDNSVATSSSHSQRRSSVACESIWEDDDDEEEESVSGVLEDVGGESYHADRSAGQSSYSEADTRSIDEETMLEESMIDLSTPTSSNTPSWRPQHLTPPTPPPKDNDFSSRPLPPVPHIPPPMYHLLHLHHLARSANSEKDPYSTLASCLAALDPALLLTPFAVFAEICYEASVRGDTTPAPPRPFSPPPLLAPFPSSSTAYAVEDQQTEDDETDDDETMPMSPTQTFSSFGAGQPLIWDSRAEEHSTSRSELPIKIPRSMSPVSPFMSQEALTTTSTTDSSSSLHRARTVKFATHPDPLMEVASLFLNTSAQAGAQDTVHGFPTRGDKTAKSKRKGSLSRSKSNASNTMRGLLRSLNINQARWVAV